MRLLVFGGWYGSGNIGDDAILIGLRNVFDEAASGIELVAISTDPAHTSRVCGVRSMRLKGPRSTVGGGLKEYFPAFRGVDGCLISGGTPFYDYGYLSRGIHVGLPMILDKKIFCFGVGVKPITSPLGVRFMRLLMSRTSLVSARDEPSRKMLQAFTTSTVALTGDSALLMQPAREDAARRLLEGAGIEADEPAVAICPRLLSTDYRSHYHDRVEASTMGLIREGVAYAADRLLQEGYQVVFLPMHVAEPDDDRVEIRDIQSRMSGRGARVVADWVHPREMMAALGLMRLVIGLRLHSLIFAASRGVPVVSVGYDSKMGGFMELVGAEGCLADPADRSDLYLKARMALDGGKAVSAVLLRSCEEIRGRIRAEARRVADELVE
jgi:polysaccharide pyruvyl transferase WcaK-like protein